MTITNLGGGLCNFIFQISACNCHPDGSNGSACDDNGKCNCKTDLIVGYKCDACAPVHENFPTCEEIGKQY